MQDLTPDNDKRAENRAGRVQTLVMLAVAVLSLLFGISYLVEGDSRWGWIQTISSIVFIGGIGVYYWRVARHL